MLARPCNGASGFVTAITMAKAAPSALEVNHLRPRMTQSPPSRVAVVCIHVGLEPGASGSVIEKQLRALPSATGVSHALFCASLPHCTRISMLPASGACALKR